MKARISVVVCTYNFAHFLPDALRSLAAQTISDFELLVADDGSTDPTAEVVAQFRPQFGDCRYLRKPHTGLDDTRNFAIQASQGAHIAFLDADDLWSPRYLEAMQRVLKETPQAELIFANGYYVRNDGAILRPGFADGVSALCGPVQTSHELFTCMRNYFPSGMLFSKSLYDRVGPFDTRFRESIAGDMDWLARALIAGAYSVRLQRKLFLYRRHDTNLSNDLAGFLRAWLTICTGTLKEKRSDPQFESLVRGYTRTFLLTMLASVSAGDARGFLRQALGALDGDLALRAYYWASYLGLPTALKLARAAKRFARRRTACPLRVDLSARPEAVFAGLPE